MERLADRYTADGVLGAGNYGVVYRCIDQRRPASDPDHCIAIKRIPLRPPADPTVRMPNPLNEVEAQKRLNHPHIVRLLRGIRDNQRHELILVLEHCLGGDLKHFMKYTDPSRNGLPLAIVQKLTAQLVSALLHLRRHRTFHRDLKAENILLSDTDPSGAEIKVSDFGFAKTIAEDADPNRQHTGCGTPLYMAPERCANLPYSFESDVWSAGLIVYEMAFGRHLFGSVKTYPQLVRTQQEVYQMLQTSMDRHPVARELLEPILVRMLEFDPAKRASLVGIVHSAPWLRELLASNEDLRALVQEEHSDASWLRDAPAAGQRAAADAAATPHTPAAAAAVRLPPLPPAPTAALEHSADVEELAADVRPPVPAAQPPGYRVMAGHVLSWCQQTMKWMLQKMAPAERAAHATTAAAPAPSNPAPAS